MSVLDVRGSISENVLSLEAMESGFGGDFPDDYEFKFQSKGTWTWDGMKLTNEEK